MNEYIATTTTTARERECIMPAKYARIACINVMPAVLKKIPIKPRAIRGTGTKRSLSGTTVKPMLAAQRSFSGTTVKPMPAAQRSFSGITVKPMPAAQRSFSVTRVTPMPAASTRVTKLKIVPPRTKVYVLQLVGGLIYVGQSGNVQRRIQQHMDGQGAMFTKRHKPTGTVLPRLGTIDGAGDSGERQEVLLQMRLHGMQSVRGWKYVNNTLSRADIADIRSNWIEMFNLCRVCMGEGHMAASCKRRKYAACK